MSDDTSLKANLAAFRAHMERCADEVLAPLTRPDIKVTIIVRAPEASPNEAMIVTNDKLDLVRDAVVHYIQPGWVY